MSNCAVLSPREPKFSYPNGCRFGSFVCSYSSGISVPRSCTLRSQFVPASAVCPKFPAQVDADSAITFCLDALIYHSSALSRSGLQFCPPQCARFKISERNGCRSRIATFTFQCGVSVSLPFPSDPVGPPSVRPFAHSICFLLRLRADAARHSKPAPDSVSANALAEALQ